MFDVLVRSDQNVKTRRLGRSEKLSVFELRRPVHFVNCSDFMADLKVAHADGYVFVKQDAQRVDS